MLPRAKGIGKGRRVSNTIQIKALKKVGPAEIQSIREAFPEVFEGVRADVDFDGMPKAVTDKSTA